MGDKDTYHPQYVACAQEEEQPQMYINSKPWNHKLDASSRYQLVCQVFKLSRAFHDRNYWLLNTTRKL